MTWITAAIFVFSGTTFWDSPTMVDIRSVATWLSLPLFALILFIGLLCIMWIEHKFVQPAIMTYWNKMFYEQDNPMTAQLNRIEKLSKDIAERLNALESKKD